MVTLGPKQLMTVSTVLFGYVLSRPYYGARIPAAPPPFVTRSHSDAAARGYLFICARACALRSAACSVMGWGREGAQLGDARDCARETRGG
jgi:hypothetical protein